MEQSLGSISPFDELEKLCDGYRRSDNLYCAFRTDGTSKKVQIRAVSAPKHHGKLLDAAKAQQELKFSNVEGTLAPAAWKVPTTARLPCSTNRFVASVLAGLLANNPKRTTGFSASEMSLAAAANAPELAGSRLPSDAIRAYLWTNFGGRVGQIGNQPGDRLLEGADRIMSIGYDPVEYRPEECNKGKARKTCLDN